MKTKDFSLQLKNLTEEGTFEGYGSIFGNVDAYGEKVVPGAFVESLAKHRREGTNVLMLWQHDPDNPIGVWEDLAEDAKGLYGRGRLILEIQKAREVRALMLQKAIGGLSIGYREVETEPDGNVRLLKKLELYEISPVAFPANRRRGSRPSNSENSRHWRGAASASKSWRGASATASRCRQRNSRKSCGMQASRKAQPYRSPLSATPRPFGVSPRAARRTSRPRFFKPFCAADFSPHCERTPLCRTL
ncbi:HK97 family phage prohead protease [Sinorhizobium meliloti]|nr:HK97 family phage prohead protease [Sinorhizobium meliloti]MDE4596728.1 HK97 family phage prohead protease [Sinorhizobium meliloti]